MTNIILCGGVGSRLWPLSRTHLPKQFARLLPGASLFESTVQRNRSFCSQFLVASNKDQSFLAANQLRGLGIQDWKAVIEPVGRNTAPAIALACMLLPPEEVLLVTPSDHVIGNQDKYEEAVGLARALALEGRLVTFGIQPTYPETGFGYIQTKTPESYEVLAFKEKPDLETAKGYVESGRYWWNSGMFCFTAKTFLEELRSSSPQVYTLVEEAYRGADQGSALCPRYADMEKIPSISIDYAVMEKSSRVACVAADFSWSDLGSFDAIKDYLDGKSAEQAPQIPEEPVLINSRDNLVLQAGRTVALVDVDNLLVVDSPDALLICKRGSSQGVKLVVDELKKRQSSRTEFFPRVERPWGNHTVLHEEATYRVKRIELAPGRRLSLHRHTSREEYWTVVQGRAGVELAGVSSILGPGQGIAIPAGLYHRLENLGNEVVIINEVQIGLHLGEDDIERLEDDYRSGTDKEAP